MFSLEKLKAKHTSQRQTNFTLRWGRFFTKPLGKSSKPPTNFYLFLENHNESLGELHDDLIPMPKGYVGSMRYFTFKKTHILIFFFLLISSLFFLFSYLCISTMMPCLSSHNIMIAMFCMLLFAIYALLAIKISWSILSENWMWIVHLKTQWSWACPYSK